MFGLTDQEAEAVQTDPVLAVEKLVVRQLRGMAATGKRIVLLVDALDEAQERGTNRVVRLLRDLGKARTNALSLVVTMVGNKSHSSATHSPVNLDCVVSLTVIWTGNTASRTGCESADFEICIWLRERVASCTFSTDGQYGQCGRRHSRSYRSTRSHGSLQAVWAATF